MEIMAEMLKQKGHNVVGLTDSTFDSSSYVTNDEKRKLKILRDFKPDLVCFSTLTHRYQWCLKFARLIKATFPNAKIMFGGPHASAVPEIVIKEKCVDVVCVGEGEEAIVEIASEWRTDIENLWFKDSSGNIISNKVRPLITDLDSLPFPNKKLWIDVKPSEFKYYLLMVSRGCPYSCSYCYNSTFHELYPDENIVRFRSVKNVIEELVWAKKEYGVRWVLPLDDNLLLKPDWFFDFTTQYKLFIDVPYCATTHPLTLDLKRAMLLKFSGCRFVKIGIQSGSEHIRKTLMNRPETNSQLLKATLACKQARLKFTLDHIFGVDDSIQTLMESIELYNDARPTQINTFQLYLFPNTPIIKCKNISSEDVEKISNGIFQEGSIKSRHGLPYRNLLTILPLLPKNTVSLIVKNQKLLNLFADTPEFLILLIKIITNIKLRNTPTLLSNLKFLPHKIDERMRGYKGEFD